MVTALRAAGFSAMQTLFEVTWSFSISSFAEHSSYLQTHAGGTQMVFLSPLTCCSYGLKSDLVSVSKVLTTKLDVNCREQPFLSSFCFCV